MEMTATDYYKALVSHDTRFDGMFFTCVSSTGIYCRPICPTAAPRIEHCSFVITAAEAEQRGFRPCLRCRPELAPLVRLADDSPAHHLGKHIEETLLMDETLGSIASKYGVSERHLRRLFVEAYGVDPKQYLTTRRLLFAKQLLQDTALPIADVAYSAGFNTPARLTISMRESYGFTPERFRKERVKQKSDFITLRADYRPPFDWDGLLSILAGRSTPLESVDDGTYSRIIGDKTVTVVNDAAKHRLLIRVPTELSRQAHTILRTVRTLFDLDANPCAIERALADDPFIADLVRQYPGTRVPGCWDKFELLLRVIVGQQISVAGATTIMRRLVDRIGVTPKAIAGSSPAAIAAVGMPAKRAETLYAVGCMVLDGQIDLRERDPTKFFEQLIVVPGIGPWTTEYLQMRVLHWPDIILAGDLGIQKALALDGVRASAKEVAARSVLWRPWRSYATMLLWKSLANKGG